MPRSRTDLIVPAGAAMFYVATCCIAFFNAAGGPPQDPKDLTRTRYEVMVVEVHDGDTFRAMPKDVRAFRIAGMDAPEIGDNVHGKADPVNGPKARDALKALLASGRVVVERIGESFGREVANVWVIPRDGPPIDVRARMIQDGFAVPYEKK